MSPDQLEDDLPLDASLETDEVADGDESQELNLEVKIDSPSACERHVTVTIPRDDIERYYDEAYSEMMPNATVPGFRPGRAPRRLVENRFRKDVSQQIKGSLLMDSMTQISENSEFTAIGEPEFDLDAVDLPDDGPMTFEFDIEVRPEFEMPKWRGLKVQRVVKDFDAADVDRQLEKMLTRYGKLVPFDGPAEAGDFLTLNIICRYDGEIVSRSSEEVVRLRSVLSFRDGKLQNFDKLVAGAKSGDVREAEVKLTSDASNEALRGQKVAVELEALEVKKLELPELTPDFLQEMGDFESEADLRDAVQDDLKRQLEYRQAQQIRQQITEALTASADWELPPGTLKRQSARELERAVLELRRAGFSETEIRARENELRQNSGESTARALKEHFILERIAEEENVDATSEDYDNEIFLISLQSGESPRRIRAQLEKRGMMDVLRNQIVERKVIDLIRDEAKFKDVPLEEDDQQDVSAINLAAGGGDVGADIPEAKHAPEQQSNPSSATPREN